MNIENALYKFIIIIIIRAWGCAALLLRCTDFSPKWYFKIGISTLPYTFYMYLHNNFFNFSESEIKLFSPWSWYQDF